MQLVLQQVDIEALIKEKYDGISEVKFSTKNVKATLEIDIEKFNQTAKALKTFPIREEQMNPSTSKPAELTNEERIKKGGMASGGVARGLAHLG